MHRDRLMLASFPALSCSAEPPVEAASRGGTVVLLHGLGGEKEDLLEELERFGRAGFLALAVDAVGHGQRRSDAFEERIVGDADQEEAAFFDAVAETAAELPALIDALAERGWLPQGRAALVGVSMGGYVALAARLHEPRVEVMVSISGSPRWERRAEDSPEQQLDNYWPAALLLLHGERDEVVDPAPGAVFVERLQSFYGDDPERLRRISFPEAGHLFPPATWSALIDQALRFCTRYLSQAPLPG